MREEWLNDFMLASAKAFLHSMECGEKDSAILYSRAFLSLHTRTISFDATSINGMLQDSVT